MHAQKEDRTTTGISLVELLLAVLLLVTGLLGFASSMVSGQAMRRTTGEMVDASNEVSLARRFLVSPPRDRGCWGCHLAGGFQDKRGTVWFDERDVHFKKFTRRSDEDPNNIYAKLKVSSLAELFAAAFRTVEQVIRAG